MQPDTLRSSPNALAAGADRLTVFAALGHFGVPNPANRFTDFSREVLFAM
jgi:hypothetical protein